MWSYTNGIYIYIFNVGRGLSIFIRLPNNMVIMYDLGSDANFSPIDFISKNFLSKTQCFNKKNIAQLVISHPHADHITELSKWIDLSEGDLSTHLLTCPNDKHGNPESLIVNMSRITTAENRELISLYKSIYDGEKRSLPLQTICADDSCVISGLQYGLFFVRPATVDRLESSDTDYVNGLSISLLLRYGEQSILIPGDITPNCMNELIHDRNIENRYTDFNQPNADADKSYMQTTTQFLLNKNLQSGLSILLTPHHGLESCFSPELYACLPRGKVGMHIISEKRHIRNVDGKVSPNYSSASYSSGYKVDVDGIIEHRNSISTRSGHILVILRNNSPEPLIYTRMEPEDLLVL